MNLLFLIVLTSAFAPAFADAPATITADYVNQLVTDPANKITRVEDLLKLLPIRYRSSYALMHTSRSLQEASHLSPRVIMVGLQDLGSVDLNEVVISFNGGGDAFGGSSLEMLQWRSATARWELSEIAFREGKAHFSGINPARCLTCHTRTAGDNRAFPLWEPYFLWSGAYGASDGHIKKGTKEDKAFRKFLKLAPRHDRYKWLVGLDKVDLKKRKQEYDPTILEDAYFKPKGYWILPPTGYGLELLNQRFEGQTAERILRDIKTHPLYATYKDVFTCSANELSVNLFPEKMESYATTAINAQFAQEDFNRGRVVKLSGVKRSEIRERDSEFRLKTNMIAVAWAAQNLLGLDPTSWTSGISDQTLNFGAPVEPETDRTITEGLGSEAALDLDCDAILNPVWEAAKEPRQSFGTDRPDFFAFEKEGARVPQIALLCSSCHATDAKHRIPFHNPKLLKPLLSDALLSDIKSRIADDVPGYLEPMPYLQPRLSAKTQATLIKYLEGVRRQK